MVAQGIGQHFLLSANIIIVVVVVVIVVIGIQTHTRAQSNGEEHTDIRIPLE